MTVGKPARFKHFSYLPKVLFGLLCGIAASNALPPLPDTVGVGAIAANDYKTALRVIAADTLTKDTVFKEFKRGILHLRLKENPEALEHLRKCDVPGSPLRGNALECIGDIEVSANRIPNGINAYLAALRDSLAPDGMSKDIEDKLFEILKVNPLLVASYPELAGIAAAKKAVTIPSAMDSIAWRIDTVLSKSNFVLADSLLSKYWDSLAETAKTGFAEKVAKQKRCDTCLSTARLFALVKAAGLGRKYQVAETLMCRVEIRKDFDTLIDKKQFILMKGMAAYGLSHYADAVRRLSVYGKMPDPIPDAIMALARSNRILGNDSLASYWYLRFAELFPKNANAQDVLWYLAWEQEEKGNYKKAITYYRKVIALKKNNGRSDEASFRVGLCLYKNKQYGEAASALDAIAKASDESPFTCAALYWKGKSQYAQGKPDDGLETFRKTVRIFPTDFYAYRASEMLFLAGDSTSLPKLDTNRSMIRARSWLDSVGPRDTKPLTASDSILLERGMRSAVCGIMDRAAQFLDGLEMKYPENLALLFELAQVYTLANDPALSYKVSRRFAWRVPPAARAAMPKALLDLMYPLPYFDIVKHEAEKNNMDPFLVLSVMRQESIFDPLIVSRVGAIGLMQLMPYTSQAVCKDLHEAYQPDSLYKPSVNIHQGAYYVKKLLDQFGGNMILAIAGYNGGPPKAKEWFVKNKHKSYDMFVEDIGFTETRNYVKKVLANYWTYRRFADNAVGK